MYFWELSLHVPYLTSLLLFFFFKCFVQNGYVCCFALKSIKYYLLYQQQAFSFGRYQVIAEEIFGYVMYCVMYIVMYLFILFMLTFSVFCLFIYSCRLLNKSSVIRSHGVNIKSFQPPPPSSTDEWRHKHCHLVFILIGPPENENDSNPRWRWTTEKSDERIEQQEIQLFYSVQLITQCDYFRLDL